MRETILSGAIAPGTTLSQVDIARELGVSRTPVREALRMLQEEGLIEAEPNLRPRVSAFDPNELDSLYALRVAMEALAATISVPRLTAQDLAAIERCYTELTSRAAHNNFAVWREAHRQFHQMIVARAGDGLTRGLAAYGQRSERYLQLYRRRVTPKWWTRGEAEHAEIAAACARRDAPTAARLLAQHVATTALELMGALAPHYEPVGVRTALNMIVGEGRALKARDLPAAARGTVTPLKRARA